MDQQRVTISLVVPMYGVAEYLPHFLDSLEQQGPDAPKTELVFIDDGSLDDSGSIASTWLEAQSRYEGQVITQENQGVSAARSRGLTVATGDWISFPDPDDVLSPSYLTHIARFIEKHGSSVDAVSPAILRIDESKGRVRDTHPLRRRFALGTRIADLGKDPDAVLMSVAAAFFPRSRLIASGASFVPELHASEDALFVIDYYRTLGHPPRLGLVSEAKYLYRRRAAKTSAVDGYSRRADTYIDRFRDQYLPRLREYAAGEVPRWLQYVLLYEFRWILQEQATGDGYAHILTDAQRSAALTCATECLAFVAETSIEQFRATPMSVETRAVMRALKNDAPDRGIYQTASHKGTVQLTQYLEGHQIPDPDWHAHLPDYFGQSSLWKVSTWVHKSRRPPNTVKVPAHQRLTTWERQPALPSTFLWKLNELKRRARASWLSRATMYRMKNWFPLRLFDHRMRVLFDLPASDERPSTFIGAVRARATERKLSTASFDSQAMSSADRMTIRLLQRADVVVTTADRAEAVAELHRQARASYTPLAAIIDTELSRHEVVSLAASQARLVIATAKVLRKDFLASVELHGYGPNVVPLVETGEEALNEVLKVV